MSPTVHKLLAHGCDIAKKFPMPQIYFAEDCTESWHKYYRKNIISHARQNSRENRLLDIFNRALCFSDPIIFLIYVNRRLKEQTSVPITTIMKKSIKIR